VKFPSKKKSPTSSKPAYIGKLQDKESTGWDFLREYERGRLDMKSKDYVASSYFGTMRSKGSDVPEEEEGDGQGDQQEYEGEITFNDGNHSQNSEKQWQMGDIPRFLNDNSGLHMQSERANGERENSLERTQSNAAQEQMKAAFMKDLKTQETRNS
jgi:hypothetical protein